MRTTDFDYTLPAERIAQHPAPRGTSRLLVLDNRGARRHQRITDLPNLLEPGDLLVVNDTRVIPARLFARRGATGGRVELLLLEKLDERDWECLARPGRRLRPGLELDFDDRLRAEVVNRAEGGRIVLRFSSPVEPHLDELGHVPLPPYIQRPDDAADRHLYQTVFARRPGAVAAPTAGLHFTPEILADLERRGIETVRLTLHVGIGTFRPVSAERVADHQMDTERYDVPAATAATIERTRRAGGRIVAVGTTVVRTLEATARGSHGQVLPGAGRTDIFITPGFRFQVVDLLVTNFHLPRSTLLMLVSALAGREKMLSAYQEAIAHGYRFYSYGDAMLVSRVTD